MGLLLWVQVGFTWFGVVDVGRARTGWFFTPSGQKVPGAADRVVVWPGENSYIDWAWARFRLRFLVPVRSWTVESSVSLSFQKRALVVWPPGGPRPPLASARRLVNLHDAQAWTFRLGLRRGAWQGGVGFHYDVGQGTGLPRLSPDIFPAYVYDTYGGLVYGVYINSDAQNAFLSWLIWKAAPVYLRFQSVITLPRTEWSAFFQGHPIIVDRGDLMELTFGLQGTRRHGRYRLFPALEFQTLIRTPRQIPGETSTWGYLFSIRPRVAVVDRIRALGIQASLEAFEEYIPYGFPLFGRDFPAPSWGLRVTLFKQMGF